MKPKIILLVLSLLLFGCGLPLSQGEKNSNVEVILSKNENVGQWILSPEGDKIIIETAGYLLDPISKEKQDINFCVPAIWLDNNNVLCKVNDKSPLVLKIDDFTQIPLTTMEASRISDLNELLQTATSIYKYGEKYDRNSFYLLNTVSQENYQIIVENGDEMLTGYNYHIIPITKALPRENEYSPNGDYYFVNYVRGLTIYDAVTNKEVVVYDYSEQGSLEVGGWAADSSGVYFQPVRGGGMGPSYPGDILKLKVPQ